MNEILSYILAIILTLIGIPIGYYIAHSASEELRQLKKQIKIAKLMSMILFLLSIPLIFIFGKELILLNLTMAFFYFLIRGTEIFAIKKGYWAEKSQKIFKF